MPKYEILQTEKSYLVQNGNFFVIRFTDPTFNPNKIELAKLFAKEGLTAEKITVVNQYKKAKRRGKQGRTIRVVRPKKYYVRLKAGQTLETNTNES